MGLAPTTSTTATLALGDALAIALLERRGFGAQEYSVLHPGGSLGKKLIRVEQLMHRGQDAPSVGTATVMADVMYEMSRKGLGMTCVVNDSGTLVGIITDGDLRRHMMSTRDIRTMTAADVMTPDPIVIAGDVLAVEALRIMEQHKITALVVVNGLRQVAGVVHLHHLWRTELF